MATLRPSGGSQFVNLVLASSDGRVDRVEVTPDILDESYQVDAWVASQLVGCAGPRLGWNHQRYTGAAPKPGALIKRYREVP